MSVIAPCRSNPRNTVASSSPGIRIVRLNHQGIRGITDQLRSEPWAGRAGRAAGASAARRAAGGKGRGTNCSRNDSWGGASGATAGLPEHQAEQGFGAHPLEGIEPATPAVVEAQLLAGDQLGEFALEDGGDAMDGIEAEAPGGADQAEAELALLGEGIKGAVERDQAGPGEPLVAVRPAGWRPSALRPRSDP
jgi:hypothetical protein